mgnify:CR=1 FL=1
MKPGGIGTKGGYLLVNLYKQGKQTTFYIHRLVATAFVPNPNGYSEVDHINRNPLDNTVENLRWVTHKQNIENRQSGPTSGRRVRCIETGQVFDSIVEAKKWLGKGDIKSCLADRQKTAGNYHWEYVEESI